MKTQKNIFIAFILNLAFSVMEIVGGIFTGSIAIISDALHDLGDATSIGLSYFFEKKSKKKPNDVYTYGYTRFSVLGGVITTLILFMGSGIVIYNAMDRFVGPVTPDYNGMIIFACVGLIVNALAVYFTHGGGSINQKAVNLHMLEDLLGWLVVLIGAVVMRFTNWWFLDPILSVFVAVFILFNALKSLKEILDIFLLKIPKTVNMVALKEHLNKIDGVLDVHHLHVWTLDGMIGYATLHIVVEDYDDRIKNQVKTELKNHDILHATVEMEMAKEVCSEKECDIRVTKTCRGHCCHHH
ncbi:MAG: cation transporter [Clostridiales bacterium]|nr:cation transporter [Clostridiales bacterium]MBE5746720.1 cation transporter [Clostridiales bacterium]